MVLSPENPKSSPFQACRAGVEEAGREWARARDHQFSLVHSTSQYLQYRIDGALPSAGESDEERLPFTLVVIYDKLNTSKWLKRPQPRLELECPLCNHGGPQPDDLSQLEDQLRDAVDCSD